MTNFTHKQQLFKNYLIKRIGFIEDTFLIKYIYFLEQVSPRLRLLGKQKKIWNEGEYKFIPEKADPYKKYIEKESYFLPTVFNEIDLLNIEIDIKKNRDYKQRDIELNKI